MNIVVIIGNLGRDPETRFTPGGQKVTTFSVASNVYRGGKDEVVWFRITVWGDRFDKMIQHLKKGSHVVVSGELHINEYTDKEGQKQLSLEVNADSLKFQRGGRSDGQQQASNQQTETGVTESPFGGQSSDNAFPNTSQQGEASPANFSQSESEQIPF